MELSRKGFLRWVGGLVAVVGLGSRARGECSCDAGEEEEGTRIDISEIQPGRWLRKVIDGKPICIRRRTGEEIKAVRETPVDSLRDPESDESRVVDPEWVVVSAVCPHAGCEALAGLGDYKGWLCFCHASHFDLSGRIRKGTAEKNLPVVTHCFEDKTTLCLGKVKKK